MKKKTENYTGIDKDEHPTHRVRLPGFLAKEEIGFGDVIKWTTTFLGIRPCGGCGRRADALNQWLVFVDRQTK